jgi:hypothetical protein
MSYDVTSPGGGRTGATTVAGIPVGLRRRWIVLVTLGELVGFVVPLAVGAATAYAAAAVQVPALVAAGAVEGAVLGAVQAHVLRGLLPALSTARFAAATAAAAAVAYAIALGAVAAVDLFPALPWPLLAAGGAVAGAALLATIGTAQWLVLRRLRAGVGFWVPVTGLAWALGLGAFLVVATPLWQPGQPVALTLAIGALAAVVMAAVMAAVTATAVVRLAQSTG